MARFKRNPLLEQQLRAAPKFRGAMREVARIVAENVREAAPVGDSGDYAKSIRTLDARSSNVRNAGGIARVESTDPFAHLVEFGSAKNPAYAPLRRGVRAAGLDLKEDPKQ